MSVWQYAQLTISLDAQEQGQTREILWYGPDGEVDAPWTLTTYTFKRPVQ